MEHYFETSKDDICQVFLTGISRDNRSSLVRSRSVWVDSCTFIGNIRNISSIVISFVVHILDTTIRKSNRVGTLSVTVTITSLSGIEVGVRVVISNSIGVGVWRWLIRVSNSSFDYRSMVSWGSMDIRGMVGWSSMDNRGSMDNGSMISRGSMDNWGSMNNWGMISWAVGKDSLGSVETIGGISNSSNSSTKSLGLCGASVFSLIWFGDRLVGHL